MRAMDFAEDSRQARRDHGALLDAFLDQQLVALERLAEICARTLESGGKLLFFGNGGSAALAQEFAGEFVNRYQRSRRPLAALALSADGALLSCIGNDFEFADIFARQIEALARPEDLAVGISTSGKSENVIRGLRTARALDLATAGLFGRDGGPAAKLAEPAVIVPGDVTARIQEVHLFAVHLICGHVERLLGLA
jgi:D-sedoheptulose 7-phosphate isomerase